VWEGRRVVVTMTFSRTCSPGSVGRVLSRRQHVRPDAVHERQDEPQLEGDEADDVESEDDRLGEQMDISPMNGVRRLRFSVRRILLLLLLPFQRRPLATDNSPHL